MTTVLHDDQSLGAWVRHEIELDRELGEGNRSNATKRVQEWLNIHNYQIVIDREYGPVTAHAVRQFQADRNLAATGIVDTDTFAALVQPLRKTLRRLSARSHGSYAATCMAYARQHLRQHPVEVGGQNRGPWVRLYCNGNEGTEWPWCAYFVTFVLRQAAETRAVRMPIRGSGSCDSLAAQAKSENRFVKESELVSMQPGERPRAAVFLVRRTSTDWTHTGFTTEFTDGFFETIEGNTNDDGSREGYEVCRRMRGYEQKDFILL